MYIYIYYIHRQTDIQTDRQTVRHTYRYRQKYRHAYRQTNRQTYIQTVRHPSVLTPHLASATSDSTMFLQKHDLPTINTNFL